MVAKCLDTKFGIFSAINSALCRILLMLKYFGIQMIEIIYHYKICEILKKFIIIPHM
jgi:hypothetical protein